MASSNKVTLHFRYLWGYTKIGLGSGFGTTVICTEHSHSVIFLSQMYLKMILLILFTPTVVSEQVRTGTCMCIHIHTCTWVYVAI